jgi:hypothetical protein
MVRWRIVDLCQWVFEEFHVVVAQQTLSRVLRKMGYRQLSARPRHHAQAEGVIEDFKKVSPFAWKRSGVDPGAIEAWFADEARVGQKNKITRRLAKRGTRPSAPKDQRTVSAHIFGATCPKDGKRAALVIAAVRHRDDEPASCRNRHPDRARRSCCAPRRSGSLASLRLPDRAAQHYGCPIAGKVPGAEPAGKRLAAHARQSLEPRL